MIGENTDQQLPTIFNLFNLEEGLLWQMTAQHNQATYGLYLEVYFRVKWDANEMSFQEVSGLDVQSEEIKYRHETAPVFRDQNVG